MKYSEETKKRMSEGKKGTIPSKEAREKMSISQCKRMQKSTKLYASYWTNGYYSSKKNKKKLFYRSSYELLAYQILEQLSKVKSYKVEPFAIPYIYDGIKKNTIPDILITYTDSSKELIEVKPIYQLEERITKARLKAMKRHAVKNNWGFSIWTEIELGIKQWLWGSRQKIAI